VNLPSKGTGDGDKVVTQYEVRREGRLTFLMVSAIFSEGLTLGTSVYFQ